MNDRLSSLLHDSAQRVPAALRHPDDVRRQARRHQRVRRATTVAASALAVALVASVAFAVQTQPDDAAPLPARPSPTASPAPTPSPSSPPTPSESVTTPPAATTTSAASPPSAVAAIPKSFRFAEESERAYRDVDPDNRLERSRDRGTPWALDPCMPTTYPTDRLRTDMLTVTLSGPEFSRPLQLALYPDETVAREVMEGFRRVLEACEDKRIPGGEDFTHDRYVWTSGRLGLGDEGLVAVLRTLGNGGTDPRPYGQRFAVFRMENGVFLSARAGEIGYGDEQPDEAEQYVRESALRNAPRVCRLVRCGPG